MAIYDRAKRVLPAPVEVWQWGWTKSAEVWNGRIASKPPCSLNALHFAAVCVHCPFVQGHSYPAARLISLLCCSGGHLGVVAPGGDDRAGNTFTVAESQHLTFLAATGTSAPPYRTQSVEAYRDLTLPCIIAYRCNAHSCSCQLSLVFIHILCAADGAACQLSCSLQTGSLDYRAVPCLCSEVLH